MFNFKVSGIAAGAAFILSLLIGLVRGGIGVPMLFLRAFIFGAVFFALFCVGYWLLSQFLPELISAAEDELGFPSPGSRVDISLGDGPIIGAFPMDSSESVDDIAGSPSAPASNSPLDQGENTQYNEQREVMDGLESITSGSLDTSPGRAGIELPDMDGFAENSSDNIMEGDTDLESFNTPEPRRSVSGKNTEMAGDFDPKELAQAIRTVLNKE